MMELLKSFPDAAPIIGDLVAKNLDWPGADDIAKRLKAMLPPNLQEQEEEGQEIPPQVQQMIQQGQQQIQEMQQALQALTQENEALKKGEMSKAADSQTKAQTERHNMIVDIASKIVLEAMKLAPEKQREAADAATQTMAHLVGEDAQMLNDTVGNLMDVAQGAEMKAASIAEVNPAAPINELKSMLELLIQQTIETKSAITAPRQVVLQEDANGKVVGGTSQIVG
jgi:DNA-directed RNA polymerase subunit F